MENPILTICIPTWNRAPYLQLTLEQLRQEMPIDAESQVEIIVSDNCSEDNTGEVVAAAIANGLTVKYFLNSENIGSDRNIAQCFNLARGRYVLLLSDDDILVGGVLHWLISKLNHCNYGVVYLRQYGYDNSFKAERPGLVGKEITFSDAGAFLTKLGASSSLISSNVINKDLLGWIDANQFCGSNLVQVHLVFRAALRAKQNLFNGRYTVACKRNNTGGYDFSTVFVKHFCEILDQCKPIGLHQKAIEAIENRMLIGYYPLPIWRQLLIKKDNLKNARIEFHNRFSGRLFYLLFMAPILFLPRPLALIWGAVSVVLGRTVTGDARRGIYFAWNKLSTLAKAILRTSECNV